MPDHVWIPALLVLVSLVILCPIVGCLARRISRFRKEMEYINMEIRRTEGAEYHHWLKKKRSLWKRFLLCRKLHK